MSERGNGANRGERRPPPRGHGNRPPAPGRGGSEGARPPRPAGPPASAPAPRRAGGIQLRRVGGDDFELRHPGCVAEMELDYAEGIELANAGEFEDARDALRYALQGCGDNLWVHVALGKLALDAFKDPGLARGHYGYAYELAGRALPADFPGRLPRQRPANVPLFEAASGLAACYDALGQPDEAKAVRDQAERWAVGPG